MRIEEKKGRMVRNEPETNIFHEASVLLLTKNGRDMSEEATETVAAAMLPLMLLHQYSDIPIDEGLEDLAKMIKEAK